MKIQSFISVFVASLIATQPVFAQLQAADMMAAAKQTEGLTEQRAGQIIQKNEELIKEIQKVEAQIEEAKKKIETNTKDAKRSAKIAIGIGVVFAGALAAGVGAQFLDSRNAASSIHAVRRLIVEVSERIITLGAGAHGEEGQMRLMMMFIVEMMAAVGFGVNAGVNVVQVEFFNKKELASLELMLSNLKTRLQAENQSLR
ncbi:MAG: hypothetical protein BroJett040_21670 [Oligoflexia bacterium]|nr:MAG: hypothetical protein BroJett040_21670 [Oligoflexia bacterium]